MHNSRFRISIFCGSAICCLLLCVSTQGATPFPSPETHTKLTHFIETQMQTHRVIGLSITVVSDQKIIYSRGFGYSDRETGQGATDRTVYRMGSISKVLTAVAIMQLVDEERIDLDAPITRYIPTFSIKSRFSNTAEITVRQLLTHHSGLPTDLMKGADSLSPISLATLVDRLSGEYTAQSPGHAFQYSNLGYALLGRIIEIAAAEPYSQYMTEHILAPLGMTQSAFQETDTVTTSLATGYINNTPGTLYPVREISAGALYASTSDLGELIKSVFRQGAPVLSPVALQQMLTRQNGDVPLDLDISMGLGWQLTPQLPTDQNAGPNVWHNGWIWHFASAMLLLPEHKMGVIVATNSDTGKAPVQRIAKKAMQLLLWEKAGVARTLPNTVAVDASSSTKQLERYAGCYDTTSGIFTLSVQDGRLEGTRNGQPVILVPLADGRFQMKRKINALVSWQSDELAGLYFTFVDVGGHIILATLDGDTRIPFAHRIVPVPISKYWHRMVGTYTNTRETSDFVYVKSIHIHQKDDFLIAHVRMAGEHAKITSFQLLLQPDGKKRAVVMGIGRYRGDTLQVQYSKQRGMTLRFQGYTLKKASNNPL